jgi:hypothetical protein
VAIEKLFAFGLRQLRRSPAIGRASHPSELFTRGDHTEMAHAMNIRQATRAYESWLRRHTSVVEADLRLKHRRMADSPFVFLRGTFYRWIQMWPLVCPTLAQAVLEGWREWTA